MSAATAGLGGVAPGTARIDHLVVVAPSLAEGVAWCEATLGVTPAAGGAHPLMGTHNRLLRIGTPAYPRAYLEIVAVDPQATPGRAPPLRRWFDLDDPVLRASMAAHGPQLAHFVASVPDAAAAVATLAGRGIDCGRLLKASRATPGGLLQWRITVRDDGRRLFGGALPTLIEWSEAALANHPGEVLPHCGLALDGLRLRHPQWRALQDACDAVGLRGVPVEAGPAGLVANFSTPRGRLSVVSPAA